MKYLCEKQNKEICTVTSPNSYAVGDVIEMTINEGTILEKVVVKEIVA